MLVSINTSPLDIIPVCGIFKQHIQHNIMGHTVLSQRMLVDLTLNELQKYGKAIREQDRIIYTKLIKKSLKRVGAISYTSSLNVWAFILLSIILEQEIKIKELGGKIESMVDGLVQEEEQGSIMD